MDRRTYRMNVDVEAVFSGPMDAENRVLEGTVSQLLFEALIKAESAANQAAWVEKEGRGKEGVVNSAVVRLHFSEPESKIKSNKCTKCGRDLL